MIVRGGLASLAAGIVFLPLFTTTVPILVVFAVVLMRVAGGLMGAPTAALIAESLPAPVRYTGVSAAFQLGAVAGGAAAPLLATVLISTGGPALVAGYLTILTAAATGAAVLMSTMEPARRCRRRCRARRRTRRSRTPPAGPASEGPAAPGPAGSTAPRRAGA